MVALDLDGTLVDHASAARAWSLEFVESQGFDLDIERLVGALTERRPKNEVFADLVRWFDLPCVADELWHEYRSRMPELVSCAAEDRRALVDLRTAGWTLGIITNGMVDNQEAKIRRLGLDALVDGWVISAAVGARKPAPDLFHALAARLGCPLDGWMVGDSLELDVAGGAAVGLKTAWVAGDGSGPGAVPAGPTWLSIQSRRLRC
jgi:HAD superfamily hydrolase (TIGR01549 family)